MTSLADALASAPDVQLGVLCFTPNAEGLFTIREGPVVFYVSPSDELLARVGKWLRQIPLVSGGWQAMTHTCLSYRMRDLAVCEAVVRDFAPDVVHVHGTEDFFGLLSARTSTPIVISIQGLLAECEKDYWGGITMPERLMHPRLWRPWLWMTRQAPRERDIIRSNRYFIGRTRWDRSHVRALNPTARYFECHEAIRPEFFLTPWAVDRAERSTVYTTLGASPLKGLHTLIRAVKLLQEWGRPVRLQIAGDVPISGWGKHLRVACKEMHPEPEWLGYLNASAIQERLLRSRVFVLPSFIENSSNSLAEAQVVGTPCVASYVGGTPSMLLEGEAGLLFPKGDAEVLAETIRQVLDDDNLAQSLSDVARRCAVARHDPASIGRRVAEIYRQILRDGSSADVRRLSSVGRT